MWRDPVVIRHGRWVHAQLDGAIAPDTQHFCSFFVEFGNRGVTGPPIGSSVQNLGTVLPEALCHRLRGKAEPGTWRFELLTLLAVPRFDSAELKPCDHLGVVEELPRLKTGSRQLRSLVGTEFAYPVAQQVSQKVLGRVGPVGMERRHTLVEIEMLLLGVQARQPPWQIRRAQSDEPVPQGERGPDIVFVVRGNTVED